MTKTTPKTLEYSTIKRSRKRVAMILVLVLVSLVMAMFGRALSGRFYTTFDRYSDERKHRIALDRDIESIRNGTIKFDSDSEFRLPHFQESTIPQDPDRFVSQSWSGLRRVVPAHPFGWIVPGGIDMVWETTTACLARLDAGNGPRYVGVDLKWDWNSSRPPMSLSATIDVVTEPSLFHPAKTVHNVTYPVVTFDTISVFPGTATHPDRATFKIIADGQEKTFVVILKKDDTIEFSELSP